MTVSFKNYQIRDLLLQNQWLPNILTDTDLINLIKGSEHRRYGLIKRALAKGDLIKIRRGLYALGEPFRRSGIHNFEMAQKIYGPSYISFESALSHWGLIPEAVYTITSGCHQRSKDFDTPFGRFSYVRIPYQPLYTQVLRERKNSTIYFVATPLRALCDYIYASSKDLWDLTSLEKSLRLEEVPKVNRKQFNELKCFFKNKKIQHFLKDYSKRIFK